MYAKKKDEPTVYEVLEAEEGFTPIIDLDTNQKRHVATGWYEANFETVSNEVAERYMKRKRR